MTGAKISYNARLSDLLKDFIEQNLIVEKSRWVFEFDFNLVNFYDSKNRFWTVIWPEQRLQSALSLLYIQKLDRKF